MTRELTFVVAPVVTDATAPALLGITPRQFRDAVRRQRVPHMKLGQRMLVTVADLQRIAHHEHTPNDAHRQPMDRKNRRAGAATAIDDFWASVEHLDERDKVNAILGQIGRKMTDEAYATYYKREHVKK